MTKTKIRTLAALAAGLAFTVSGAAFAATPAATPASAATAPTYGSATTNWFGGPMYNGKPALAATAALVKAGGGAEDFSFSRALVSMLGEKPSTPRSPS